VSWTVLWHRCELPEDWAQRPAGSLWLCPACRRWWRVRSSLRSGEMARKARR